jgi:hypothetical protein
MEDRGSYLAPKAADNYSLLEFKCELVKKLDLF